MTIAVRLALAAVLIGFVYLAGDHLIRTWLNRRAEKRLVVEASAYLSKVWSKR